MAKPREMAAPVFSTTNTAGISHPRQTIGATRHLRKIMAAVGLSIAVSACAYTPPEEAPLEARPNRLPVKNVTGFSEALRCMDNLFLAQGVSDIVITSDGIPDATGKIAAGTKEMLISAISKMSVRSGAFRFVDYDQNAADVNALSALIGFSDDFLVPTYYLRGAISQLDEGVVSESAGASVAYENFSAGIAADQVVSVVSLDLNMGNLLTRQIISGTTSNNSIAVRKTGAGGDAGGEIVSFGVAFQINFNRSEGTGAAVRTLIELGAIETLGKLSRVPYWRCLSIEQTNPEIEADARDWYADMSDQQRVELVQTALSEGDFYDGAIDGVLNAETRTSIGSYQAANGLIADGRINFDLYASLISGDLAKGRPPQEKPNSILQPLPPQPERPLSISVTTPIGPRPVYQVGAQLTALVRPNNEAYVSCYYKDARGDILRIFPNRFQPDALVAGGTEAQIPGPSTPFGIVLDTAGATEEIMCLAVDREVMAKLPQTLQGPDLEPLPVASLEQVKAAYGQIRPAVFDDVRIPIQVTP